MDMTYLADREAIIGCGTQLVRDANHSWIGMGRTAAWIKLPEFRNAVVDARARDVDFKIVVFYEGDAHKHSKVWLDLGAEIGFFEHGYIRIIICDSSQAIVAFPKVVTSTFEDREYFGFHIRDEQFIRELINYFKQIWEESEKPSDGNGSQVIVSVDDHRIQTAGGVLRFVVRVIRRAFPDWF